MQTVASAALQQQQQPVPGNKLETLELAELSKAAFAEQDDPVNPFTLFGTTRYKAHLSTSSLPLTRSQESSIPIHRYTADCKCRSYCDVQASHLPDK